MKRYKYNYGKNPEGALSTISGYATETTNFGETAFGILNKSTRDEENFTTPEVVSSSTATLFSVGNGTDHDSRKNIIELKADGTVYINGVGQYDGTNPGEATDIADEFQGIHDDITGLNEDVDRIDNTIESIHISEDDENLIYTLLVDGQERGTINIPRDQFLKNVSYNEETNNLEFTFIVRGENNEEVEKQINVNMTDLEDIYSAGDGLNLENKQFSVKVDADTQPYIEVTANGVKVIGIDEKFNTVNQNVTDLANRVTTAENDIDNLETRMDTAESDIDAIQSDLKGLVGDGEGSVQDQINKALEDYLPLSGGTMAGNIEFSGSTTTGIIIQGKSDTDLVNAAGGTTSIDDITSQIDLTPYATKEEVGSNIYTDSNYLSKETNLTDAVLQLDEEIKATNDNLALEHTNAEATYATKAELDGYLPLSGGTLTGYLKMRELDGSELKHETFSLDLVQGYFDNKDAYMKFDVHPSDYSTNRTMIEIGNLIDSNTAANSSDVLGIYSDFFQARFNPISKSFAVCNRPNTSKDVMWSDITLAPRDDDEAYVRITSYLGDSKDSSNFNKALYKSTGITLRNKTASDLLHAAGGTVSIQDIISQVTVPTKVSELTNDSGYQTEAQVAAKVSALVDSAPETLDTLNELAAALGDDPNFATTVTNQIASKQDKLVSGTNIKTINGQTLLGSGDIALDAEHITVKDTLGYFSGNNVESALQEIAQPLDTHLQNMTNGLRHIPSGGAPNNILAWDSEGTAKWENLSNIEISTDDLLAYGVQWDTTVSDPVLTRIGNTSLHKSLPIQSGMYGCICQGSTIRYRLDDEDWRFKRTPDTPITVSLTQENDIITINDPIFATKQYEKQWIKINDIKIQIDSIDTKTQTATLVPNEYTGTLHTGQYSCELGSVRNGYDGSVRVYVPGFYYKSTQTGNICQVLLSISQIDSTYHYQQPVLIDAYRCTVLNTVPENMGWLSTLPVNTAVSIANVNSYCRGGNNNSSFDQYLENDPRRTQLGKPRTNLSRATMRGYAANNNSHLLTYEEYKNIFYWLYVVEYANFNSQATFSSSLDDNGYRTGGLGNGVTTMNYNVWVGYNSIYPLTPCGYLDSLGGNPGVEPQVLAAFDMTVTPTKNWGSWTDQTYRSGNNNLNRATMSKGNPTLTITHVDNVGQILYCRSDNVSGVATYTVSGLQSGQELRFECSGQTTQIVTIDGQITMDWGTNGAQTRSLYANFTGDCNITVTCDSVVDSIVAEYPSQSITVNRWRGFDNPFGDIWTNLDGVIIDADADNHENSTDYVYVCTDPSKFSDTLTDDYIKIAESTHNEGYVKAFDLGDDANIIASTVGGGGTTYMCDYHWTGNANTTLRTLYVGGCASDGASAGLGGLLSRLGVSYAYSYLGFRSVSVVSQ